MTECDSTETYASGITVSTFAEKKITPRSTTDISILLFHHRLCQHKHSYISRTLQATDRDHNTCTGLSKQLTNLMHKFLFYNKFIIFLYMFRAMFCSALGGQNCIIQHLVSSHSVGGRPVRSPVSTCAQDGRLQCVTVYLMLYNTILTS